MEIYVIKLNNIMDKFLQQVYADLILEYQSGFNPPQRVPKQEVPQEAGTKLSYNKQVIGIAPPMVTSHVYGEQEEELGRILKIIQDVEDECTGNSDSIDNAIRNAFAKLKEKLNSTK
jgi:hypothetical protein